MAEYEYLDSGNDSGTILGYSSSRLIGFWGTAPCDQAAALTTQLTTITYVSATTADYAIRILVSTAGYGFATENEAMSFLAVVANLQTRLGEIETALEACGIIAAN